MLESEDSIVDRFDFERADYRVLIALREDYLAHLEGLKQRMPSITQNRMRLARMTGQQALTAVTKPGGRLVTEEVAEAIVRFVAGGAELRNAEVEPSLLSLVCRELNNTRIAQGRPEISADLLAGSRDTILHEFYERALTDQPEGVRCFIEDEMLTESGFRESLGEERVLRAFAAAGAAPSALATLVNRRLLRIEERLDLRRVELTHDVLCAVVAESRELRHEREAKEEAERQLEAQKAREVATRKALVRARQVAFGCAVLAIVAIGAGIFGYQNMIRARDAEAKANAMRGEAEKLVVYLLDDFYLELEPVGRLDIVADLSRRALAYYASLPQELRTTETERNRALALVRYGFVLRYLSKLDEGGKVLDDAIAVLTKLQAGGDRSEATTLGLGLGLTARARVFQDSGSEDAKVLELAQRARDTIAPLMAQPSPSERARRAYGSATIYLGFAQQRAAKEEDSIVSLEAARKAYRGAGNLAIDESASTGSLAAAAGYAEASAWQVQGLQTLGRLAEAQSVAEDAARVASAVLERRPNHMPALRAHALLVSSLSGVAAESAHYRKAIDLERESLRDWTTFTRLDAGNAIAWNNLANSQSTIGFYSEAIGGVSEALASYRLALKAVPRGNPGLASNFVFLGGRLSMLEADAGIRAEGVPEYRKLADLGLNAVPKGSYQHAFLTQVTRYFDRQVLLFSGRYAEARDAAREQLPRLEALKPANENEERNNLRGLVTAHFDLGWTAYILGDLPGAATHLARSVAYREKLPMNAPSDKRQIADTRTFQALALARIGHAAESVALAEAQARIFRAALAEGSEDMTHRTALARALLAIAIASPERSRAALAEAATVLGPIPAEMKRLRSVAQLQGWIAEEAAKRS
jgi:tetratricopeptide (TPR) repeat protein